MTFEEKLYKYLSNDTKIQGLVGDRIYHLQAPQEMAVPYIVYQIISSMPQSSISGTKQTENKRVQISVWAESDIEAANIAETIEGVMCLKVVNPKKLSSELSHELCSFDVEQASKLNEIDRKDADTGLIGKQIDFEIYV
jgi:hypothetical protein